MTDATCSADEPAAPLGGGARLAVACLFAIVGVMPLVVSGQEALALKPVVFVALALVGALGLLVDALRGARAPALGTPVDVALAAFFATALLSLADTSHPELVRYTLGRFAALALAYLLTIKTIRTLRHARWLAAAALAAGAVIGLLGLDGYRTFVDAGSPEALRSEYLSTALFAHSYLAAQSLVMLLAGAVVYLIHAPLDARRRVLVILALVPIAAFVIVIGSRGAYLAAVFAIVVSSVVAVSSATNRRAALARLALRMGGAVLALVLAALVADAAGLFTTAGRHALERVMLMFDPDAAHFNFSRLDVWRDTLRMASDHWLTGIGIGAYDQVLSSYHASARVIPHAHNQFLHVLAAQGLIGLVSLFFVLHQAATASRRSAAALRDDPSRRALGLALTASLASTLVYFMFEATLELPEAGALTMVALALLTRCGCHSRTATPSRRWTGAGALALGLLVVTIAPLWTDAWHAAEPTERALAALDEAVTWSERGDTVRADELKAEAIDALADADASFPYRADLARTRADLLFELGRWDEARAANEIADARQPNAFVHLNAIGKLHMRRGEFGAAIEPLRRAISSHRGLGSEETYWSLGRAYLYTHRLEEAWIVFRDLIANHAYHEIRPSLLLDAAETLLFLDRTPAFTDVLLGWYVERVDDPSSRLEELQRHLAQQLARPNRPRER